MLSRPCVRAIQGQAFCKALDHLELKRMVATRAVVFGDRHVPELREGGQQSSSRNCRSVPNRTVGNEGPERISYRLSGQIRSSGCKICYQCIRICSSEIDKTRVSVIRPPALAGDVIKLAVNRKVRSLREKIRGFEADAAPYLSLNADDESRIICIFTIVLK